MRRIRPADAVLLEEAGPLKEQLGNALVYVRDTDPLARGRPATAGYEGVYVGMQVEMVSKGLHHSAHSRAKALLLFRGGVFGWSTGGKLEDH
jgi:hypothetical protein